jgi:hypothetical protein
MDNDFGSIERGIKNIGVPHDPSFGNVYEKSHFLKERVENSCPTMANSYLSQLTRVKKSRETPGHKKSFTHGAIT